ncbi:MAG: DUF664 domain-containing protein [Planctomycetes bacterium]|nr:DUF664 domain-containing protein [Planctomycetota bacterium]
MSAPSEATAATVVAAIAVEFRRRLQREYVPRIRQCVALLASEGGGIWRRPAPNCNSVGNLLLHLAGNTRQWIHASFGDLEDRRDRPAEFAADGGADGKALVEELERVVDRACDLVSALPAGEWLQPRVVQGYDETGLSIVLHVLEHFSGHAGQIYAWTKQVTGQDLRFYDL